MVGTILNTAGIVLGGLTGLVRKTPLTASTQGLLKLLLGLATVVCGFWLIWTGMSGRTFGQAMLLLGVVLLASIIGKQLGQLLRLQQGSNRLGRFARDQMESVKPGQRVAFSDAFNACAIVFCASPLGIAGAIVDGMSNLWFPLAVKAFMDGLAAMGFIPLFGRAPVVAALPVLAFQGSLALCCRLWIGPWLDVQDLTGPVIAAAGVLMFAVALVILESKRIHLADYLPSLVLAPLLWWLLEMVV